MEIKIILLYMILRGLLAQETNHNFSLDRLKNDLSKAKSLMDYEHFPENQNQNSLFYKQMYLSDGLNEVKRRNILYSQSYCPCESQYEIKDLGEGHYPRHITVSSCKPKACQDKFNSCKLLKYMIHILSERDTSTLMEDDSYMDDNAPLPESLRHKWQLKPMYVAVACVSET
ncbi:prothoracicotropic hormone-like [Polistes fuscatus]|uniref:prothoracicotropic hormone-like n=1 Tax=Polistes fuscatus TaxID=30207 RepID=UPI001CA87198|nr:prothoracicotropic hormone-like [Polistes fuscatus]XP_043504056.1 prothoracicotropic hormone-like [Polistes fuscatus]XP_043504057.1 prothoracicotropic hormone-like [Polistes fuscatus]